MKNDYMIRAVAADNAIRAYAVTSRDMVETARDAHNTSPVMTAALGRLLSAGAMMGSMLKGEKDLLTLQIQCSGPAKGLTVTADSHGNVKGFAMNPVVDLPPNAQGHLNVGGALDLGILSVIKDLGLKEPYVGQCELQTGEIAEDLTYYFAVSEQVPSAVGLGVLMNQDNTVKQAGGFIIQLMPDAKDEVIENLEKRIQEIDSVTMMLDRGLSPEKILEEILGDFGMTVYEPEPVAFSCDCSKERVRRALATISKKDLDSIINDGESIEVKCQFCNKAYTFEIDELKELSE